MNAERPHDVRPGNVMGDRAGHLLLIDACFVKGHKLIAGIFEDADGVAIELRATTEALC